MTPRRRYRLDDAQVTTAPTMQVNIPYPVHREDIRGRWQLVAGAEAPAICWGRDGRYWAWLHDLADDALMMVLGAWQAAAEGRRRPWGR